MLNKNEKIKRIGQLEREMIYITSAASEYRDVMRGLRDIKNVDYQRAKRSLHQLNIKEKETQQAITKLLMEI